jgi:hypothetical protein
MNGKIGKVGRCRLSRTGEHRHERFWLDLPDSGCLAGYCWRGAVLAYGEDDTLIPVLKAPFPYFGGKSKVAPEVWAALCRMKFAVTERAEPFNIQWLRVIRMMRLNFPDATATGTSVWAQNYSSLYSVLHNFSSKYFFAGFWGLSFVVGGKLIFFGVACTCAPHSVSIRFSLANRIARPYGHFAMAFFALVFQTIGRAYVGIKRIGRKIRMTGRAFPVRNSINEYRLFCFHGLIIPHTHGKRKCDLYRERLWFSPACLNAKPSLFDLGD